MLGLTDEELKIKAKEFVIACNVHGLVHAKEGGVIYL